MLAFLEPLIAGSNKDRHHFGQLELTLSQNLQPKERLKREAEDTTPIEKLRRLLSTKSAISTASLFAERQHGTDSGFREIGKGCTGIVFEKLGTAWASRTSTMNRGDTPWNHYVVNLRIQESFDQLGDVGGQVDIPCVLGLANESSGLWRKRDGEFSVSREVLCIDHLGLIKAGFSSNGQQK